MFSLLLSFFFLLFLFPYLCFFFIYFCHFPFFIVFFPSFFFCSFVLTFHFLQLLKTVRFLFLSFTHSFSSVFSVFISLSLFNIHFIFEPHPLSTKTETSFAFLAAVTRIQSTINPLFRSWISLTQNLRFSTNITEPCLVILVLSYQFCRRKHHIFI